MYKNLEIKLKKKNIILYLIGLLPLSLLIGTFVAEIIVFLTIVFFLYELFIFKNFKFLKNNLFLIFAIIYIYLIINLFSSLNFDLSFNRAIFFLRFPIFVMATAYFIKKNNYNFDIIYKLWAITISVVILDLYFQYIFGFNTLGFTSPWPERLTGFLGEELKIAHILIGFGMHVLIFYFIKNKNMRLFYIFLIIYLIILFLVNERSNAIKGTLIIFFSYLFINEIKIKEKIIFLTILISLVVSIVSLNKTVNQRFFLEIKDIELEKDKLSNYIKYTKYGSHYLSGIEIFKQNPILGSGIKTFREACYFVDLKKYYKNSDLYKYRCSTHPHQVHIEWLAELGLIGYSLFIILFIYLLIKSIKIFFVNKNSNILCPILFVICHYLPLLPSGSFFTNFAAIIFWINVGIIYSEILKYE